MADVTAPQTTPFTGMPIGVLDINKRQLCCGSLVRVTERKDGYTLTTTQDGWGRDVRLDRSEWRDVPPRVDVWDGRVFYSPSFAAFRIIFTDRWPDEDFVYMFKEIELI